MKNFKRRMADIINVKPRPLVVRPITRTEEVITLASNFRRVNPPGAAEIACLWHIGYSLLMEFGTRQRADLTPLVDTLRVALHQRARDAGVGIDAVHKALLSLQQAGETAAYLNALPD